MAAPFAIMTFLMFQSSLADSSMTVKTVVMFVTYILWGSVFYTAINIPYGSMSSVMTEDTKERASLSTWRNLGATVAGLTIGALTPQLIYSADAAGNQIINPQAFTTIVGVFSVLSFVSFIVCFKLTTERVKFEKKNTNEKKEKVSPFKNFGLIFKNRALLAMIAASIVLLLTQLVAGTMNQYLYADYFKNIGALSTASAAGLPISLVLITFIAKLSGKVGKKEISVVAMLFTGSLYLLAFFLRITNPWVYVTLSITA